MAKTMKDVTGDGKFTYADVLKMRGVKLKKSMDDGGYVYRYRSPAYRMAPMEMRSINVGGNPASAGRLPKDFRDQIYDMFDAADMGLRSEPTRADIDAIDRIPNRSKNMALADREYVGGLKEQPFIERKADILRERDLRGLMDPMRLNLPEDMKPMQSRKPGEIMGYGGKVKLMKKSGTVDYMFGGALAAGLGQIAQRAQNPTVQKIGKVASMLGGLSPAGKAVNMAGNVLQNFIPAAGAQPNQQGVRDTQSVAQASPQQGGGFMNLLQSPVGQMAMQALPGLFGTSAKRGMVVPNAKVRLLKLER